MGQSIYKIMWCTWSDDIKMDLAKFEVRFCEDFSDSEEVSVV
jgi:hypothetical protein